MNEALDRVARVATCQHQTHGQHAITYHAVALQVNEALDRVAKGSPRYRVVLTMEEEPNAEEEHHDGPGYSG